MITKLHYSRVSIVHGHEDRKMLDGFEDDVIGTCIVTKLYKQGLLASLD